MVKCGVGFGEGGVGVGSVVSLIFGLVNLLVSNVLRVGGKDVMSEIEK